MSINSSSDEPIDAPTPGEPGDDSAVAPAGSPLSSAHGFSVEALDGDVGEVETPLFPPAGGAPDFLVVRLAGDDAGFAVVPVQLVARIDVAARRVSLDASGHDVAAMRGDIALEY